MFSLNHHANIPLIIKTSKHFVHLFSYFVELCSFHLNYLRTVSYDSRPMCDTNDGLTRLATVEVLEELLFGMHVEGAGRFVQEQYGAFAKQGTGDGDALSLPFAEAGTQLSAEGIQSVGTVHDEAGTGRLQGFAHVILRSIGIAKQQVVADGAAEEGVALRDIDQVVARPGRNPHGLLFVIHLYLSFRGLEQSQDKAYQRCLTCTRLAEDSRSGTLGEVAGEMRKDGATVFLVAEADILETHASASRKGYRIGIVLERRILEFHKALAGSQGTDEDRNETGHIAERTLNLSDKLDEGNHHTISNGTRLKAVNAPKEGDEIACAEPDANQGGRRAAEDSAMADVLAQKALCLHQFLYHRARPLQRLEDGTMLDALLKDALDAALRRTDITGDGPHLAHIDLTQDKEAGHDADKQASQTRRGGTTLRAARGMSR